MRKLGPTSRAFLTVLAIVGATVTAAGTPAAAAQPAGNGVTTGGFRPAPITWAPCPEDPTDPTVSCGTLRLPVDWADPHGASFTLALAKRAATDPSESEGPLLINPGGPGGSGVDFALAANQFFSPAVQAHFDIIGFDPRGVDRSSPILCSTDLLNAQPFPVPASQGDYTAQIAYNKQLWADCRAHTGALFDHVDTLSVARDMDAIRAALGQRQISYYGVSYGTLLGQEYAETFPDRIRAMVIDSNMDHSLGTAAFLHTEEATDEDSFEQFVAWCDRDTTCALHGQDVNALWTQLEQRADAGTLTTPGTTEPVDWFTLTSAAISGFYGPMWSKLAQLIAELAAEPQPSTARATANDPTDLTNYPIPIFCEDWTLPVSGYAQLRRYFADSERTAPELRTSSLAWGVLMGCLNWTGPLNDPQQRLRVHADYPLLEINSVHDPATPYAWAVDDAAQLGRAARFVTYEGWGHGAYPHSGCTIGTVDAYLIDRTLPAVGTSCPAVPPPDQTTTAGPLVRTGSLLTGTPTFG
ncbi:MAG TPA: alpha/beta fold hydrolase [Pseudonocardiaceae bacterium]|nr:alpha/beta fold hydrolase [Pseudonocardiaceae bacterium]